MLFFMSVKMPLDEITAKVYAFNKRHGMSDQDLKRIILCFLGVQEVPA